MGLRWGEQAKNKGEVPGKFGNKDWVCWASSASSPGAMIHTLHLPPVAPAPGVWGIAAGAVQDPSQCRTCPCAGCVPVLNVPQCWMSHCSQPRSQSSCSCSGKPTWVTWSARGILVGLHCQRASPHQCVLHVPESRREGRMSKSEREKEGNIQQCSS